MNITNRALERQMANFFEEDDLSRNITYLNSLPNELVQGEIFIKSDLVLAGLPWFQAALEFIGREQYEIDSSFEGKKLRQGKMIPLGKIPFSVALTGERIALNLLQRASSIATFTSCFVEKAQKYNIAILDTRKTTPGLRALEKYAVNKGGGYNHRLGQTDAFMVKDNHKTFFGGVKEAISFFKSQKGFYTPLILEVHNLEELKEAVDHNVSHVMLDNFSPEKIKEAVEMKPKNMTYEVSGGINLESIENYLIEGVDAISMGCLTYDAPQVDISFKYKKQ
jgi:nicotinate-nucleotide pyrophosphorylase (carboxylating)